MDTVIPIFADDGKSHLLLNPKLPAKDRQVFEALLPQLEKFRDHFWILSSGSSKAANESAKLIGLSKAALRASAESVNRFLHVNSSDVWGQVLPDFHVGGLSIWARAELSKTVVIDLRSEIGSFAEDAAGFVERLNDSKVSLLSLVPTQVFDLVSQKRRAPNYLRAVVVGGAALSPQLRNDARALGWPLLPSFGMTEACSQIATASLESLGNDSYPRLRVLDHMQVDLTGQSELVLRGPSLLTGFFVVRNGAATFHDPKIDGGLVTSDRVQLITEKDGKSLIPAGRASEFVKIQGEGVDILQVRERFFSALTENDVLQHSALLDVPDDRVGAKLVLVVEKESLRSVLESRINVWNAKAFPPERILVMKLVPELPRTDLGKIAWGQLREQMARELKNENRN